MNAVAVGNIGERIAKSLWPSLQMVPSGSYADKEGTDAIESTTRFQIKADSGMRDRVFWELFKRTGEWASFGDGYSSWRRSPAIADMYIFVGYRVAIRVSVEALIRASRGRTLTALKPNGSREETAMGFLLPVAQLLVLGAEQKEHSLWQDPNA